MRIHHLIGFLIFVRLATAIQLSPLAFRTLSSTTLDKRVTVDAFISTESPIAKAGVLANIGSTGSKASGARSGVVIASPSTSNPDYWYTWIRDSSLVLKVLIDQYTQGRDTTLLTLITDWITSQTEIQQVSNPSGTVTSGGLGEPKFNVDQTAFTGAWGRPQRDGPALRATSAITFANYLSAHGNTSYVTSSIWPIVKLDLDYVAANWNYTGFDLWEEVDGSSFFTIAVQHRALLQGAAFATSQSDSTRATTYTTQAANLLCFLQTFWNGEYAVANVNVNNGRSGLDINSVLTSIHSFDPTAGCDALTFQPCSDKALANHKQVVDRHVLINFRGSLYSINSGAASNAAVATGRYKEDVYYNGNPWYLSTLASAEQLYGALYQWNAAGSLTITSTSLAFFQQFSSTVTAGTYASSSSTYTTLTSAIKTYADGFVEVVQSYTPSNGGLSEQFDKASGVPLSAADLTWSYASALTAFDARAGHVPDSSGWGAAGLSLGSCAGGSGGATEQITFNEAATTVWGENIYLTGSISQLSDWSTTNAIPLSAANYPTWSVTVSIPASTTFQYKYIRIYNGAVTWESDPNRQLTSPASGSYTENDSWR